MLRDFEMIVHKFPDGQDITIIPIADVHLGARECMEQEFISFINSIADKPNVYVCLLGDLLNNAVKSSVSNIYDELYRPSEAKRMMAKILEPIRERILFSVTGNHERRTSREMDDDPNYDIMAKLDLEHLHRENVAFVKLQFGTRSIKGQKRPTYTMVGMHGSGGGALAGYIVWYFVVPLFFGYGRTMGKRIFGLAVIRTNCVKVTAPVLFIRTVVGMFAIETMMPLALLIMIYFNMMGIVGLITIGLLGILQVWVLISTKTNSSIHDLLTDTAVVEFMSQQIFDTQEDLLHYVQEEHAKAVENAEYDRFQNNQMTQI